MMFMPNEDGFLNNVQAGHVGVVTMTASDDVGIVVDSIRRVVTNLGLYADEIRIWPGRWDELTLLVEAK
jgi:hypothetical protein